MNSRPITAANAATITPLRFPVLPFADESLPGLVSRATRDHVLEQTSVVLKRANIELQNPGAVGQVSAADLVRLAQVLRCDEADICDRSFRYCENDTRGGPIAFGDAVLYREDLVLDRRQIGPITLQSSSHHRAPWLIGLLPYCPLSTEKLVDQCPNCPQKRLGWKRSWGIAHCELCGEIIPPSSEHPLRTELVAGYKLFANLMSADRQQRNLAVATLSEDARRLDPKTLLNCILKVGCACRPEPIKFKRNTLKSLPADVLASVVSNGAIMIRGWPESINRWSHEEFIRLEPDYKAIRSSRRVIRNLAIRSAPAPQKRFMHSALPDIFGGLKRSFDDTEETVVETAAARIAGVSRRTLQTMCDAGLLEFGLERETKRPRRRFRKAQVRQLGDRLSGSTSSTRLELRLGLPQYAIEQLCCLGFVEEETCPSVALVKPGLQIKVDSIDDLFSRFDDGANRYQQPGTVPLATASRRIGGRLKPWGAIIRALLDGSVPYWIDAGPTYGRQICVLRSDMVRFDSEEFYQADHPGFAFSQVATQREAIEILNTDANSMRWMADLKLLNFIRNGTGFHVDRGEVMLLGQRIVAASELAERLSRTPLSIVGELGRRRIPRVGFGWERQAITELFGLTF